MTPAESTPSRGKSPNGLEYARAAAARAILASWAFMAWRMPEIVILLQIESQLRSVDMLDVTGIMIYRENLATALDVDLLDPARRSALNQFFEALVPESSDHERDVMQNCAHAMHLVPSNGQGCRKSASRPRYRNNNRERLRRRDNSAMSASFPLKLRERA